MYIAGSLKKPEDPEEHKNFIGIPENPLRLWEFRTEKQELGKFMGIPRTRKLKESLEAIGNPRNPWKNQENS